MVRSIDSRLSKLEEVLNERMPVGPPMMSREECREFALSLGREILAQASGSTVEGEWMRRLKDLSELDRQAVRNVTFGLWAYGCFGPACQRRILEEWWAASAK
jgi:hypothetical protein